MATTVRRTLTRIYKSGSTTRTTRITRTSGSGGSHTTRRTTVTHRH